MSEPFSIKALLQSLSDDALTDEQFDALAQLLEHDTDARTEYLRWRDQEAQLYWNYAGVPTVIPQEELLTSADLEEDAEVRRIDAPPGGSSLLDHVSRRKTPFSMTVAVATLAAMLLVLAMVPATNYWKEPAWEQAADTDAHLQRPTYVAQYVRSIDAVWTTAEAFTALVHGKSSEAALRPDSQPASDAQRWQLPHGMPLRPGEKLCLAEGVAEIVFTNGASVILEAPAMFVVEDRDRGRLELGRLVGKCSTPRSRGFEIGMPVGKIIDLGTEFGIEVQLGGYTEVSVLEGVVAFQTQSTTAPQSALRIRAGQTVSWQPNGTRRVASATNGVVAAPRFVRRQGGRWLGVKNVVADYQRDFQPSIPGSPTPASRWRYMWNEHGPIGDAQRYTDLVWSDKKWFYAADSIAYPAAPPARFARLTPTTGHPGLGAQQSESGGIERFVIAAYTVESPGRYSLINALVRRNAPPRDNEALQTLVFIDDQSPLVDTVVTATRPFDVSLGDLEAGQVIYVAIGPHGDAGNDGFSINFSIFRSGSVP